MANPNETQLRAKWMTRRENYVYGAYNNPEIVFFLVIPIAQNYAVCETVRSSPWRGSECPCGTGQDHRHLNFHAKSVQKFSYYTNMRNTHIQHNSHVQ